MAQAFTAGPAPPNERSLSHERTKTLRSRLASTEGADRRRIEPPSRPPQGSPDGRASSSSLPTAVSPPERRCRKKAAGGGGE